MVQEREGTRMAVGADRVHPQGATEGRREMTTSVGDAEAAARTVEASRVAVALGVAGRVEAAAEAVCTEKGKAVAATGEVPKAAAAARGVHWTGHLKAASERGVLEEATEEEVEMEKVAAAEVVVVRVEKALMVVAVVTKWVVMGIGQAIVVVETAGGQQMELAVAQ